jgi:hypothetical protein
MSLVLAVIMILIVVSSIGGIIAFKKKKKEEAISSMLFAGGMTLITSASSDMLNGIVVSIGIMKGYSNVSELKDGFNSYYFVTGVLMVIAAVYLYFLQTQKLHILNINSYYDQRIENYSSKLRMSIYDFKEIEVDTINIYKELFQPTYDNNAFITLKNIIEKKVTAFKTETSKLKKGYTGIAPIPLIVYAGTFLERTIIDEYFEFDKINTQCYYKLKKNKLFKKFDQLEISGDVEIQNQVKEVVIAVSLTQKIENSELNQFKNLKLIELGLKTQKDNAISNVHQLKEYTNNILDLIEKVSKTNSSIKKIHLIVSGQSCLALELGKRFVDVTRLPEIICYQYDRQNNNGIYYPWGVAINGNRKGDLIRGELDVRHE